MFSDNEKKHEEFKTAFEAHYNALCNYALGFLSDKNIIEDIVQEVFVKVWEKRQDIIGSPSIRYYLFTAVRNNCLSQIEQNKKEQFVQSDQADKELSTMPDEKQDENNSYFHLVKRAMSLLPPKCKEVFLLSRVSGLSYKEIAQSLGISIKTVENQIGKALKILKNFVKSNRPLVLFFVLTCFQSIINNNVGGFVKNLFF
ncbi:MAG TPA: RNA polymerase sigma-70 factor [Puia sp.]|nr:RNA polymerase sigma-70 factor [Puia sp.]